MEDLLIVKNNFKVSDKVKMLKDIPSVNGMLHKNTIVKIDELVESNPVRGSIRVIDNLGKIWWVTQEDITNV